MSRQSGVGLCVLILSVGLLGGGVYGAFSPITNPPGNELSVEEMLEIVTGVVIDDDDPMYRVDDSMDHMYDSNSLAGATFIGLMWGQGSAAKGTLAHTAGYDFDGGEGDMRTVVFDSEVNNASQRTATPAGVGEVRFFAANEKYGEASTDPARNEDLRNGSPDRVVTFDISEFGNSMFGLKGAALAAPAPADKLYLLFFDTGMDSDFNDFVMLVEGDITPKAAPNPGPEPPEPGSGVLLVLATGIILVRRV